VQSDNATESDQAELAGKKKVVPAIGSLQAAGDMSSYRGS
jgi:hypothetical protein